ncbi:MAG: right-handed parallel beta-helix repeat-containing protein [Candidatus Diapherotrites archaeon]|nr:right-handed parallel beta-helix repeat-containing protein [Candidatus Diapherotrites archaeon]
MRWQLFGIIAFALFWATTASAVNSCGDTNHVCTLDTNISSDMNFIDGNTYVLLRDVNVTGSGTDLNIAPGAVVKYTASRSLIAIDGGRIAANGTADKNIVFTSCKDQNTYTGSTNQNTSSVAGCSGAPAKGDYNVAIYLSTTANITDATTFSYLKVFYPTTAFLIAKDLNSIHDSNFTHVLGNAGTRGALHFITASTAIKIHNNVFEDINSASNPPDAIAQVGATLDFNGDIYNNRFNGIGRNAINLGGKARNSIYSNDFNHVDNVCINDTNSLSAVSIYKNKFKGCITGIVLANGSTNINIFDNNFSGSVIGTSHISPASDSATYTGNIFKNNFVLGGNVTGIHSFSAFQMNIFDNNFNGTIKGIGIGFTDDGANTNYTIYNNIFHNMNICFQSFAINIGGSIYNNTCSSATTGIVNSDVLVTTITRNLFSNVTTAFNGNFSGSPTSNNAFFQVDTIGGSASDRNFDINSQTGFTVDPFIADGTDRNFLLNTNASGGAKLVDAGLVDTTAYFAAKTTRLSNKLDTNKIDIGYHYDQNAPYVIVRSPSDYNVLSGTQTIDFNVESGYGAASAITTALAYSTTSNGAGTSIVSQALSSYSCSALPIAACAYTCDTTAIADGNYFIKLTATDTNGTSTDYSDHNFQVQQNNKPDINVLQPDGVSDSASTDFNVVWRADDRDGSNTVQTACYADTDNAGYDQIYACFTNVDTNKAQVNSRNCDLSSWNAGDYYIWCRATDSSGAANSSDQNYSTGFLTQAIVSITLKSTDVNLGTLRITDVNTSESDANAIWIENNGNVKIDINISAVQLFIQQPTTSTYFNYKASDVEIGSLGAGSTTSYTAVPIGVTSKFVDSMDYVPSADEIRVDLNVQVPADEPPGLRQTEITLLATQH